MPASTAIYCRISDDTAGQGLGVARQEKDCRRLAESLGWPVGEVYVDNDISAFSGKVRPRYRQLLADLDDGKVDALICWHSDRLHRSPLELEEFIELVERTGAPVQTVTAGLRDLSTPTGRLHARIEGNVARYESEHRSERIKRKHLELAENGKVPGGGRRPFGYDHDRRTIRPDEAALIREAAARVLAGASVRSVVSDWKARGVRSVTGAAWSGTTVKRLLMSGRISGQREHHGHIVSKAEWPAIITPEQTARLRALLKDPKRNRVAGVDARSYLLAGLVYCGKCGGRMTTTMLHYRGRKSPRYACHVDRGGCNGCGINATHLEDLVREAVAIRLDSPAMAKAIAKTTKRKGRPRDAAAEVAEVDERRAELAAMWAAREITTVEFRAAREALDAEQARIEAATVEAVTVERGRRLPEFRDMWSDPGLPFDERRAIVATLVDRVVIAPTTRGNNKFDPDRVDVRWKV